MGSQTHSPLVEHQGSDGGIRKRVCKACDRCRLKKSKCDGSHPCSRCKTDNAICVFGERKKSHDKVYPKGYVEMLEQQQTQLVSGLQEMYKRMVNGQGWQGSALSEGSNGSPLTHDILDRLGALKQDLHGDNEPFEEDMNVIQQRLVAKGAGFMQRAESTDGSESPRSTVFDAMSPQQSTFADPLANFNQVPLTPPDDKSISSKSQQGSIQLQAPTRLQLSSRSTSVNPAILEQQNWSMSTADVDDGFILNQYDSLSAFEGAMSAPYGGNTMLLNTLNPNNLPLRDWTDEEAYQKYFNTLLA